MDTLRKFPIGAFVAQEHYSEEEIKQNILAFKVFPSQLRSYLETVPESSWDSPYRQNGWTIRQVVHHLADSHSILYFRVKQAITCENPTVPGYPESIWATLPDSQLSPWVSIPMIEALHARLVSLFETLPTHTWQDRLYFHSGYETWYPLSRVIALYRWHGEHHLAHIRLAAENPELS
ncbi:MAG: YfiT family bacillithiol transferase [Spirosomataceae bacterium]